MIHHKTNKPIPPATIVPKSSSGKRILPSGEGLPQAERISVCPCGGHCCQVTIDQNPPFTVREPNGTLLALMAQDAAAGTSVLGAGDALVPFKLLPNLISALAAKTARDYSRRAVVQRIWRLRNLLVALRLHRELIESHRSRGYRFRVARA
jgi:hypothetical protein